MPDTSHIRINGVAHQPVQERNSNGLTAQRLSTIVESAHLNLLIGAGTSLPFFAPLGNIEEALTDLADTATPEPVKALVRISIQAEPVKFMRHNI